MCIPVLEDIDKTRLSYKIRPNKYRQTSVGLHNFCTKLRRLDTACIKSQPRKETGRSSPLGCHGIKIGRFPPVVKLPCGWICLCYHHLTYHSLSALGVHYHFASITSMKNIAFDLITMFNIVSRHNCIFLFRKTSWYSHILFTTFHKISWYFTKMSWTLFYPNLEFALFMTLWNLQYLSNLISAAKLLCVNTIQRLLSYIPNLMQIGNWHFGTVPC